MITVAALLVYTNQIDTAQETAGSISSETASMYTDLYIRNVYGVDYLTEGQENRNLAEAMSYGCRYTEKGEKNFGHVVSDSEELSFFPQRFLEEYGNRTMRSNFFIEMDCDPGNESSRVMKVGKEPPTQADVIVRSIPVPLPQENLTHARLHRWY